MGVGPAAYPRPPPITTLGGTAAASVFRAGVAAVGQRRSPPLGLVVAATAYAPMARREGRPATVLARCPRPPGEIRREAPRQPSNVLE